MPDAPDIRRLGRLPSSFEQTSKLLRLARYLIPGELPPLPESVDWREKADKNWGWFKNDVCGDCTCASLGHLMQAWTAAHGAEVTVTDQQVIDMYVACSKPPYNPRNGANDNGASMLDVLGRYRRIGFAGRRLGAFAAVTPQDQREVKEAIYLTGGLYLGVGLPLSAKDQKVWSYPTPERRREEYLWERGSWGGHCIGLLGYFPQGVVGITWGEVKLITWQWLARYGEESYALIAPEWVNRRIKAPNGIALDELLKDVEIATSSKLSTDSPLEALT